MPFPRHGGMMRRTLQCLGLAGLLVLAGCGETPTGRSQLALVPDALMAKMGSDAFVQMRQQGREVSGTPASQRVECISHALLTATERLYPEVEMPEAWQVVLFEEPSPNAFALPGGRIGVHTGLLRVAESPAQLAAVIGHEISHVLADHGNERMTQQLGIKAALLVVGLLGEGDMGQQAILQALGVGARLGVTLPFSRAHEEEADLMGLRIMAAAGFDPAASVALWRNMAQAGNGQPPELLSTHPAHESRIEALQANLPQARELARGATPACE
ncbi:M48 family metallopeptidase [Halomonas halmophila]|nr:M48 family metallopeptidase [Halomonas halmophila]